MSNNTNEAMNAPPYEHGQTDMKENTATHSAGHEETGKGREKKKAASAFRTISEVAGDLGVQQHVLRFWETKFTQVKPLKRGGGRRYYRPEDVEILRRIHHLLYTEGYTIKGVQKLLKGQGKQQVIENMPRPGTAANEGGRPVSTAQTTGAAADGGGQNAVKQPLVRTGLSSKQRSILEAMLGDLKELRSMIKTDNQS